MLSVYVLCLLLMVHLSTSETYRNETFNCDPEEAYQENNCNYCRCWEDDSNSEPLFGCTMRLCESSEDPKYKNCPIGSSWDEKCNTCWCVKDVGTVCTYEECDDEPDESDD